MRPRNPNTALARALVEELVRSGLDHACVSPGSRSSALALAIARERAVTTFVVTDERSAGFFALGMARELRRPVALLCTSGTAAANYLPAVVEASLSEVPLVVLTADRPAELRECRAPQTIDQVGLYGGHVRFAFDLDAPSPADDLDRFHRRIACRAVGAALGPTRGPVHLNVPIREPLFDSEEERELDRAAAVTRDRPTTRVVASRAVPSERDLDALAGELDARERGIVVAGPTPHARPEVVAAFARHLEWPILADPVSGLRFGAHDRAYLADAYDVLLRDADFAARHRPDAILQLGALPASRALHRLLDAAPDATHVVIASSGTWPDPLHRATAVVHADADSFLPGLGARCRMRARSAWAAAWLEASAATRRALDARVAAEGGALEGKLFPILVERLPAESLVVLGNSMPIRDADTFLGSGERVVRFVANRGANGIDGVTSSALGAAAVREAPTVLVTGDLSFLHDLSALQIAARHRLSLLVIVVQNDGGGIFSFLPQADLAAFEPLFGTPHGLDLEPAVRMCGGRYAQPASWNDVGDAIEREIGNAGLRVLEIRSDRTENRSLHRRTVEGALAAWRSPEGVAR
jgi:2-succinyl-5-enolpyruvyl-6-hydroxy-3-cyclohexene-1-carboxylate synthase